MKNIQSIIEHAEHHCKKNGSRLTNKRKNVLYVLLQSQKALSAYELIDLYNLEFKEMLPAMSAYRILEFFQHEQLAHKLNITNKYVACSHIRCDHDHAVPQFLICNQCQKVEEISINKATIHDLEKNVEQAGYKLVSPQLEMNCICEKCAQHAA